VYKDKKYFIRINNKNLNSLKGSSVADILIIASIILFVFLPIFCALMERYMVFSKSQIIRDAIDVANLSLYYAIETETLGKGFVSFNEDDLMQIYKKMLSKNLLLDAEMNPTDNSIIGSEVRIESIMIYTDGFPSVCPFGTVITNPAVHSYIIVPIKPVFFKDIISALSGKEYTELKLHIDSDIPINN